MAPSRDAALLTSLAAELHGIGDEAVLVQTILRRTCELVPEADDVSLSLRGRRGTTTLAATSERAQRADELQQRLGEGPGLDLARESDWSRSGDLRAEPRWPGWGPAAADLGLGSVLSLGLVTTDTVVGALHLYATGDGRFNDGSQLELARLFGVHVATALTAVRQVNGLEAAVGSRHSIGLAQGILMERYGIDRDRSFEFLRRMSSTSNRKLREVAADVAAEDRRGESEQLAAGDDVALGTDRAERPRQDSNLRPAD